MGNKLTADDKLDFLIKFMFESTPRRSYGIFADQLQSATKGMSEAKKEELAKLLDFSDDLRNEILSR